MISFCCNVNISYMLLEHILVLVYREQKKNHDKIIQLFISWAFNGPEYLPKVEGTALFVLLPKANSRGQWNTLHIEMFLHQIFQLVFDCSGKIRLLLGFFYQIKCSYLNITESFHTIIPSDHCKYTHLEVCPRYLCSKEILGNFLYF